MAQTISAIPIDVSDPLALKRFLTELTTTLDEVIGYRGDSTYATSSQLGSTTSQIGSSIRQNAEAIEELKKSIESLQEAIDSIDFSSVFDTEQLGTSFEDFNSSSWSSIQGRFEFKADGADLTNAPFTAQAGTEYIVYVESTKTSDSVWQEIIVNGDDKYIRTEVSSNWIHLAKV